MISKDQDHIIWDAFRQGNHEALELIYGDNYLSLKHYAVKFKIDESFADDLIQELFMDLIESGSKLSHTTNIRFYLLGALRKKIYNLQSKKSFKKFTHIESEFSIASSIEDELIKKEVEERHRKYILTSIQKLSIKQQEIIYLRFYNNLSYKEIAQIFNTKTQTVQNLMGRAIRSLKEDFDNKKIEKGIVLLVLKLKI